MINRAITKRAEHKNLNYQLGPTTMVIAGAVLNLSNFIIQGDNYNQRSGNTIRAIHQTLWLRVTGLVANSTNRFILVRDNENNGVTPIVTDILEAANFTSGYAGNEVLQQKRFTILKDWMTNNNLNGQTITSTVYKSSAPFNIHFNGAGTGSTSNGKGAIFLVAVGSSATATLDLSWQITYTDS
jgi:hypothetical protein